LPVSTTLEMQPVAKPANVMSDYLDECELAEEVGHAVRTVQGWRHRGKGPPYIIIGRRPYYRRAAVRTWLLSKEKKEAIAAA